MAILLSDSFTEAGNVNLSAHTMNVGPGWTSFSGTWTVVGATDVAQPPSGVVNSGASADAGAGNVGITCDIVIPATGSYALGLGVRIVDIDNNWTVVMEADAGGGGGDTHRIDLIERNGGSNTIRRTATITGAFLGNVVTLTVVTNGNDIDCSISGNGSATLTTWSTAHANASVNTSTLFGLYAYTGAPYVQSTFDNFLVTGAGGGGVVGNLNVGRSPAAILQT